MTQTPILELRSLSKVFHQNTVHEQCVLNHIDLALYPGEFVTVIGGNGAGKSTLLNIIAGYHKPNNGTIFLNNQDITEMSEETRAKHIARVFQDPRMGTAPRMTIAENLAVALLRGKRRLFRRSMTTERKKDIAQHVSLLEIGLEDRLDTEVEHLSGGQRQSIALLMATINMPQLLLLDEHTAALDPQAAEIVMTLTDKMVKQHQLTTLMITHNMEQAIRYGNRLLMLHHGKIVVDIKGNDKQHLTTERLMTLFQEKTQSSDLADTMVLG